MKGFEKTKPTLIALPTIGDLQTLTYRNDVYKTAPKTWDELVTVGSAAMKAGKIKNAIVFRGVKGNPIVTSWYPIFLSYGGKFFDDKWNVTFNNAQGKAAADFFVSTLKPLAPRRASPSSTPTRRARRSSAAMPAPIIQYTGNAIKSDDPTQSKEVGKLDFAVVPKQVKAIAQIGIFIHGVSASAPNKDNAITFMKWFATDAAQTALARAGDMPVRTKSFADPKAVKAHRLLPTVAAQLKSGAQARPRTPGLVGGRDDPRHGAERGAREGQRGRSRARQRRQAVDGLPEAPGLLQLMASQRAVRARKQGAGLDRIVPFLLLAPAVLLVARGRHLPADHGDPGEHEVLPLRPCDRERRLRAVPPGVQRPALHGRRLDDVQVRRGRGLDRDGDRPRPGAPVRARSCASSARCGSC